MKITNEVLTEYLNCKYKAYLILKGVGAEPSAYERWLKKHEEQYADAATRALLDRDNSCAIVTKSSETGLDLRQGIGLVIGAQAENESFAFSFHALQRVPGASALGPFHYVPVLFSNTGASASDAQKLALSCESLILERLQQVRPRNGILVSGDAYKSRTIDLETQRLKANKILDDLTAYLHETKKPRLWLNDHCHICRYQQQCKADAQHVDDLSLLNRMSEREIQLYQRKGISTVSQLSYTFRFRKRGKRVKARGRPHSFPLQALAIREQSVFVVSAPVVPKAKTCIYIDMEGSSSGSFIYLIGMLIVEDQTTRHQWFWANSKDDEEHIYDQFLQYLYSLSNFHLFFYGSYEPRIFRRIVALRQTLGTSESLLTSSTNVLSLIYANIYFPTYSNELKEIGKYLGCQWSSPDSTGRQSILWRAQWENSYDHTLKDRLITYNREDCLALQKLTEFLSALPRDSKTRDATDRGIRFIEEIKTDDGLRDFGQKPFAVDEFALITEHAYFDYQRDKIYFRTNPAFKHIQRRKKQNKRRNSLRPNKVIDLWATRCPECKGRNIFRDRSNFHARDCLDLRISTGGIRRCVIHYRTPFHRCQDCDRAFVPRTFRKKTRFGHGLISWTVDQHVGNRITFQNLERTVKDYFGLSIRFSKLHEFKSLAAEHYSVTYDRILQKLVDGAIIHADETKVNLQKGSGYVWVLSNMEEVLYLYKPSREADFLHELLARFKGVLITDFFTGYDSLRCLQQKCLIHLIRDVNDDLLENPFDQELKELATLFGRLLRRIIATIDRVGLRTSHLRKHKPAVKKVMDLLGLKSFESDIAGRYCKRILKYQAKLFTFLDHDGVPWNNNNAEHAVKYFAKYRRLTNGRVTESGLQDYLLLLSLYQTCKYKEIRFLDFLLSKERDIDHFADMT